MLNALRSMPAFALAGAITPEPVNIISNGYGPTYGDRPIKTPGKNVNFQPGVLSGSDKVSVLTAAWSYADTEV